MAASSINSAAWLSVEERHSSSAEVVISLARSSNAYPRSYLPLWTHTRMASMTATVALTGPSSSGGHGASYFKQRPLSSFAPDSTTKPISNSKSSNPTLPRPLFRIDATISLWRSDLPVAPMRNASSGGLCQNKRSMLELPLPFTILVEASEPSSSRSLSSSPLLLKAPASVIASGFFQLSMALSSSPPSASMSPLGSETKSNSICPSQFVSTVSEFGRSPLSSSRFSPPLVFSDAFSVLAANMESMSSRLLLHRSLDSSFKSSRGSFLSSIKGGRGSFRPCRHRRPVIRAFAPESFLRLCSSRC
mmetsp:Transcript_6906/g.19400  ORF Transcript_6906/g.19400 Transcript_6906/m.19400 type:complete len:305 (+) Transcript_6906:2161-3075(+)